MTASCPQRMFHDCFVSFYEVCTHFSQVRTVVASRHCDPNYTCCLNRQHNTLTFVYYCLFTNYSVIFMYVCVNN